MMLLGAFILAPNPDAEPVAAVHDAAQKLFHGFGTILLVCSIPGLIAVTAMNMYSGALSSLTTVDTIKRVRPTFTARWLSVLFITIVGTGLALLLPSNFLTNFNNFLLIVLYFMIPWTAVNLIDFFFVRKGNYAIRELFKPHGMYGAWSWRGLFAYLLGFAVMIPFFSTTIYEGPVAHSARRRRHLAVHRLPGGCDRLLPGQPQHRRRARGPGRREQSGAARGRGPGAGGGRAPAVPRTCLTTSAPGSPSSSPSSRSPTAAAPAERNPSA